MVGVVAQLCPAQALQAQIILPVQEPDFRVLPAQIPGKLAVECVVGPLNVFPGFLKVDIKGVLAQPGSHGDGDDFRPGGKLEHDKELAREFAGKNLRWLAKLHKNNFVHGGFTPRNELYILTPDSASEQLHVVWLDLATCRKAPFFKRKKLQKKDVDCFLSALDFPPDIEAGLHKIYLEELKKNG